MDLTSKNFVNGGEFLKECFSQFFGVVTKAIPPCSPLDSLSKLEAFSLPNSRNFDLQELRDYAAAQLEMQGYTVKPIDKADLVAENDGQSHLVQLDIKLNEISVVFERGRVEAR